MTKPPPNTMHYLRGSEKSELFDENIRLAVRGYLVLGSWAILWIVAAVMCSRIATIASYDYKGAWPNALHDMPANDARSVLVSEEK